MISIITACVILGADAELSITANSKVIRQRDPLLVKAVVDNRGDELLSIETTGAYVGHSIRYQQRIEQRWEPLPGMSDGDCALPPPLGGGVLLAPGASCAEYHMILLNAKKNFVFDKPGQFELRAVVQTSIGELISKSVVVTVEPRPREQLERIEQVKGELGKLGGDQLTKRVATNEDPHPKEIPDKLIALQDVGGNIGSGVKNLRLVQRIISGGERVDAPLPEFLAKELRGVDLEIALLRLGHHYHRWGRWEQLSEIVDALPDTTLTSRKWSHEIERRTPASFVPRRKPEE